MIEGTRRARVSLVSSTWISCNSFGKGLDLYLEEQRPGLSATKQGSLLAEVQEYTSMGLPWVCRGDSSRMLVSVEADVAVSSLHQETSPHSPLHTSQRWLFTIGVSAGQAAAMRACWKKQPSRPAASIMDWLLESIVKKSETERRCPTLPQTHRAKLASPFFALLATLEWRRAC